MFYVIFAIVLIATMYITIGNMPNFMMLIIKQLIFFLVFLLVISYAGYKIIFSPLWENVHADSLTGLHNRHHMEKFLPPLVSQLSRSGDILSVLMIDIDFFKAYNDTYGHDAGDKCLKAIATVLRENIGRAGDMVIRYGGEEFLVVLPSTDENGARLLSEKLFKKIEELKIEHKSSDISEYVTVSIGAVTGKVSHTQTWQDYMKRADEALYVSKNNNRNTYTFLNLE